MPIEENVNAPALLSAVRLSARWAEEYPAKTRVIDVDEVVRIVSEIQADMAQGDESGD